MATISYNPLFKLLIDKGLKKSDLSNQLGLSSGTIAKLSRQEYVSMDVLVRICHLFHCQLSDIVDVIPQDIQE